MGRQAVQRLHQVHPYDFIWQCIVTDSQYLWHQRLKTKKQICLHLWIHVTILYIIPIHDKWIQMNSWIFMLNVGKIYHTYILWVLFNCNRRPPFVWGRVRKAFEDFKDAWAPFGAPMLVACKCYRGWSGGAQKIEPFSKEYHHHDAQFFWISADLRMYDIFSWELSSFLCFLIVSGFVLNVRPLVYAVLVFFSKWFV